MSENCLEDAWKETGTCKHLSRSKVLCHNSLDQVFLPFFNLLAFRHVCNTVEENLRGMKERKNKRMNDTHSGFLILDLNEFKGISGDFKGF